MIQTHLAGVDEVGRGPLAGPVVAAAVILDPNQPIDGLTDSKKLSEKKRELLSEEIKTKSLSWAIASASVTEIDDINILRASHLAMQRAVESLHLVPHKVQIDGNFCPSFSCEAEAIIKGDLLIPAISAASIIAKVYRDHLMIKYHEQYPEYHFNKHKGYGTKAHLSALVEHGPCEIHRQSFAPVKKYSTVL